MAATTAMKSSMSPGTSMGLENDRYGQASMDPCYRVQSDPIIPLDHHHHHQYGSLSAPKNNAATMSNTSIVSDFSTYPAERTISAPATVPLPFSSSSTASIDAVINKGRDRSRNRAIDKLRWRTKKRLTVTGLLKSENWQKNFPPNVFEGVVKELKNLHVQSSTSLTSSSGCSKCYVHDLLQVALTCKSWLSEAQKYIYTDIHISDPVPTTTDNSQNRYQINISLTNRLIRLRRSLRSTPHVASLVRTLRIPDPIIPLYLKNEPNPAYDDYLCLLASIVMSCPKLESVSGFHPFYNHTFDRLTHAVSTRARLKEYIWIIAENDDISLRAQTQLPPGLMDSSQKTQFLEYHHRWIKLETLMLCSPGKMGILEHDVFVRMFSRDMLPKLSNLCVSSFDSDDFTNETLMSLPPTLKSLRIEECEGVTDQGWMRWAASAAATNGGVRLEKLSIIHQNITSLITISKILAGLDRLNKFTISQSDVTPQLPEEITIVVQPLFANQSLEWLHWDIAQKGQNPKDQEFTIDTLPNLRAGLSRKSAKMPANLSPNTHLALSILNGGFPILKNLRAPRDTAPMGILQSVCQPLRQEKLSLTRDRFSAHARPQNSDSNSLQTARIRAQMIIDQENKATRDNQESNPDHKVAQQPPLSESDPNRLEPPPPEGESGTNSSFSSFSKLSNFSTGSTATNLTEPLLTPSNSNAEPTKCIIYPSTTNDIPGRDWDKEVVVSRVSSPASSTPTTLRPTRLQSQHQHQDTTQRESICHCPPSPTSTNRESICQCDHPTTTTTRSSPTPPQNYEMTSLVAAAMMSSSSLSSSSSSMRPNLPLRSPLRPSPSPSLISKSRYQSTPKPTQPNVPQFNLQPDIPLQDSNGGLAGNWGVLLNVGKRQELVSSFSAAPAKENNSKIGEINANEIIDDDDDDDGDYSDETKKGRNKIAYDTCIHKRRSTVVPSTGRKGEMRALKCSDFF